MACGDDSCELTEKVTSAKAAVETSKGVASVYSFTSSPIVPITNILVPSFETATPVGEVSSEATSK